MRAIVFYYGHVDPDTLDDDKLLEYYRMIEFVRKAEAQKK